MYIGLNSVIFVDIIFRSQDWTARGNAISWFFLITIYSAVICHLLLLGMPWFLMRRQALSSHPMQRFLDGKRTWTLIVRLLFPQLVSLTFQFWVKKNSKLGAWLGVRNWAPDTPGVSWGAHDFLHVQQRDRGMFCFTNSERTSGWVVQRHSRTPLPRSMNWLMCLGGHSDRELLWIISRSPRLGSATY